ncbi:MAG: hypothetical protein SGILL_007488 [Bacillariaceae sp.]
MVIIFLNALTLILMLGNLALVLTKGQNTQEKPQATNKEVSTAAPFLTPELKKLVNAWKASSISAEQAKQAVWNTIQSDAYVLHRPSRGILFVKTHKTASSTVTSVLHSVATSHNLTTPVTKTIAFGIDSTSSRERIMKQLTPIPGVEGGPYDIWCNHADFHPFFLRDVVPTSRGKYVSIVRDPAGRLRSACGYFKCCPADTWEAWADFILATDENNKKWQRRGCRLNDTSKSIIGNSTYLQTKAAVDNNDLLLLVTDRFTESMLVLWGAYGLRPLDVTYMSKKERTKGMEKPLSAAILEAQDRARQWQSLDTAMFDLANTKLSERMKDLFPDQSLRAKVQQEFEELNNLVHHVCADELHNVTTGLNYWCQEKKLDNVDWNKAHFEMLGKKWKAYKQDQGTKSKKNGKKGA